MDIITNEHFERIRKLKDGKFELSFDIEGKVYDLLIKFRKENRIVSNNEALRRLIEYYNNIKDEYKLND